MDHWLFFCFFRNTKTLTSLQPHSWGSYYFPPLLLLPVGRGTLGARKLAGFVARFERVVRGCCARLCICVEQDRCLTGWVALCHEQDLNCTRRVKFVDKLFVDSNLFVIVWCFHFYSFSRIVSNSYRHGITSTVSTVMTPHEKTSDQTCKKILHSWTLWL